MVKQIFLSSRKSGLSHEEFVKYYEEVHAPLVLKQVPSIKKYVRNYIDRQLTGEPLEIDCISELWHDNMEELKAMQEILVSETGKAIEDSAKNFIDINKNIYFLVDENVSE